jgi:lipoprotein-releasing system permease protein
MYRAFLSRRYLTARLINVIGIVGVLVAVGALVLIVSIMSGFLEESRRALRGSLADLVIQPELGPGLPRSAAPLLSAVAADPRVTGAAAELVWGGFFSKPGENLERVYSSPTAGGMAFVQLLGVDVNGVERLAAPSLRAAVALAGGVFVPRPVQDELTTTELFPSLTGGGRHPRRLLHPVPSPLLPFVPPEPPEGRRPLPAVVIGEELALAFGFRPGDEIQIITGVPDPDSGEFKPNNRVFVVAGTFRSGENEADLGRIYFDRRELADFLSAGTREYSQVLVRLADYEADGVALRDDLRASLAEEGLIRGGDVAQWEVRTWEDLKRNLLGAISNERVLMMIMLSLVLLVAGFTIFAILSMMVTEKRRDIGILCALGATPAGVLQLFVRIALWDSVIGGVAGALLGTWMALELDAIERGLSSLLGVQIFDRSVYLFDHIPTIVEAPFVVGFVVAAVLVAVLFAILPAWRASRLDPVAALRYE